MMNAVYRGSKLYDLQLVTRLDDGIKELERVRTGLSIDRLMRQ